MKQLVRTALIFLVLLIAFPSRAELARQDKIQSLAHAYRMAEDFNEYSLYFEENFDELFKLIEWVVELEGDESSVVNKLYARIENGNYSISQDDIAQVFAHAQLLMAEHSDQISDEHLAHMSKIMHKAPFIFSHIYGTDNTFVGLDAGNIAITGDSNSGFGKQALQNNSTGTSNTALGFQALQANTTGFSNMASGGGALASNTIGDSNTASGMLGLFSNTSGSRNSCLGQAALFNNVTGSDNTAVGRDALNSIVTGTDNIAIGSSAGSAHTLADSANIDIGNAGVVGDNNTIRIGTAQTRNFQQGIYNVDPALTDEKVVIIDSAGQLGTTDSVVTSTLTVCELNVTCSATIETLEILTSVTTCDLIVDCNVYMQDSVSIAQGNVFKNAAPFIHNYGTNNTFVGKSAGNFSMTGTGGNTAMGVLACNVNTTGRSITAIGANALQNNTTGNDNVAVGFQSLISNTTGSANTSVGSEALRSNTTSINNTAVGREALRSNTTGSWNTSIGAATLKANTTGIQNIAMGHNALTINTTGSQNVAVGNGSLENNITGSGNVAMGFLALQDSTGSENTAIGGLASSNNTSGVRNIAVGYFALINNTTGSDNIVIGRNAGATLNGGSGNIYLNADAAVAAEASTIRIGTAQTRNFQAGIRGATTGVADAIPVLIDSAGQLGTISSSRRYKDNIVDMADESSAILQLRPVTFSYKSDAAKTKQYGLIAEEVAEVLPALVVRNAEGQIETVKYHELASLLLNELIKQHAVIEEQKNEIQELKDFKVAVSSWLSELYN